MAVRRLDVFVDGKLIGYVPFNGADLRQVAEERRKQLEDNPGATIVPIFESGIPTSVRDPEHGRL